MDYFIWALILLGLGLFFLVLEFFIPSGGMLGLLCALCLIGSVVLGFMSGSTRGAALLLGIMIIVPAFLFAAIHYWPETTIGKLILIPRPSHADEVLPDTTAYRGLHSLVGKRGVAKSLMLPGGIVQVEGQNYDAISEGSTIEAGQPILVVQISTQRLVVRYDDRPFQPAQLVESKPAEAALPAEFEDPFAEEESRS
ncbi:NfeD family protein [Anatilimnocola sp. NA78]|uniref:NfeD family protein n=1 Tax=Anatilimnocola sp. NA78 TaxID=3415683 RepID=UPI003CE52E1B